MDKQIFIILGILLISGIVKGTTGFGFALFSLPLLAHYISFKTLIPVLTLFNLSSSTQMIIQTREFNPGRRIIWLSISGIIGTIAGTLILKFLSPLWLKFIASVSLVIISILFISGYRFKVRKYRRGNIFSGLLSGFLGGSIAVSGPPLALFLTSLNVNTYQFRKTFAWFSIVTAGFAFIEQIKIDVVNINVFKYFLYGWPIVFFSVIIGKRLNKIVPVKLFYRAVVIITFISGVFLFISCFRQYFKG